MEVFNLLSNSNDKTMHIAKLFAKHLYNKDVVVLSGELGCGKTKFVEGFLSYFGLQDEISSPTFNIVNEYIKDNINIYHFDVYRLTDIDEFFNIGGEEYFEKGICLIEWGEIIEDALPPEFIRISFEKVFDNDNARIINFEAFGQKNKILLETLKEELI